MDYLKHGKLIMVYGKIVSENSTELLYFNQNLSFCSNVWNFFGAARTLQCTICRAQIYFSMTVIIPVTYDS